MVNHEEFEYEISIAVILSVAPNILGKQGQWKTFISPQWCKLQIANCSERFAAHVCVQDKPEKNLKNLFAISDHIPEANPEAYTWAWCKSVRLQKFLLPSASQHPHASQLWQSDKQDKNWLNKQIFSLSISQNNISRGWLFWLVRRWHTVLLPKASVFLN